MKKGYAVDLTKDEQAQLAELVGKEGEARARKMNRAHILLLASQRRQPTRTSPRRATHHRPLPTLERTRRRAWWRGRARERALNESSRPAGKRRKLDWAPEAYVVALARSQPPEGKKRWGTQLRADGPVEVGVADRISDETGSEGRSKGGSSRG
jgi:hypothetical protein